MNDLDDHLPVKRKRRERFEERVAILFEELKLAVEWQRSTILFSIYGSEFLREKAEAALQDKLSKLGQSVCKVEINKDLFDLPLIFTKYPDRDESVYFLSGLQWGGGIDGHNAYRSLNLRREYFVDNQIRVIFWLTEGEAGNLPRLAPDFWSFRHRVVEFIEAPIRKRRISTTTDLTWPDWNAFNFSEDLDNEIDLRKRLLARQSHEKESLSVRADLNYALAALSWAKNEHILSLAYLNQGKVNAQSINDPGVLARFWVGLGFIFHVMNRMDDAIVAYKNAIKLLPRNTTAWISLSNVYRDMSCTSDAIEASKKAIKLAPEDAAHWNHLGNIYRDQRRMDDSIHAYENAIQLDSRVSLYWANLGTVYQMINRIPEATASYQQAIKLAPRNTMAHISLAACYRKSASEDEAKVQLKKARKLIKTENEYCQASLESVCGNMDKAMGLIKIALQKKQTSQTLIRYDPNLDFIRGNTNFRALMGL